MSMRDRLYEFVRSAYEPQPPYVPAAKDRDLPPLSEADIDCDAADSFFDARKELDRILTNQGVGEIAVSSSANSNDTV
jgi:hypothetical protein